MNPSKHVVVASAIFAIPLGGRADLAAQQPPPAVTPALRSPGVRTPLLAWKWPTRVALVGIDLGTPIYQNERGETFSLDPVTGDQVFLAAERFAAFTDQGTRARAGMPLRMLKWSPTKFSAPLSIVGVDQSGHVLHRNERGETFYLDPVTADLIYVR